jgi:RHS repeat-associated protein
MVQVNVRSGMAGVGASLRRKRRYRTSRALGWAVEALERRWMLSAILWNGGMGNWNDPTKWSTGTVPGSADDVTIAGGTVNITDGESARTLISGGILNISSSGTLGTVEGGTLSGTVDDQGLFYGSGDAASPLVLAGSVLIAGQMNNSYFRNTGQLNFGSAANVLGAKVANDGDITVFGGANLGSGTFTNDTGATIAFTDDSTISGGAILNSGTVVKNAGTGQTVLGNNGLFEDLGGTVSATSGTLAIADASFFQNTVFSASAGASVSLDQSAAGGSGSAQFSGTITGSGAGHLFFVSGLTTPGNPQVGGSTLSTFAFNFSQGFAQVTGMTFRQNGGQLINSGYLQFTGDAQHPVIDFDNTGTLTVSGEGSLGFGNQTGFINDTTGVIDFTSDAGALPIDDGAGGNFAFTNKGLIEKTGGTGNTVFGNFQFDNEGGSFAIDTGTLTMQGSDNLEDGTTLTVLPGATLEFDNDSVAGNSINANGNITGTGGGTVLFNSGAMYNEHQASGDSTPTATLQFAPGMAQVTQFSFIVYGGDAEVVNAGELNFTGSATHPDEGLDNQGVVNVTGTGDLGAGNGGGFVNDTTGTLNFETDAGVSAIGGNTAFINDGLIKKTGGTGDSIIGTGTGGIGFSSTGGSYDVESGTLTLQNGGYNGGVLPFTVGNGTITAAPGAIFALAGHVTLSGNPTISGGGVFELTGGELDGPNGPGQDNAIPAVLDFDPHTFIVDGGNLDDNLRLINTGTIDYVGGSSEFDGIDNKGTITFDSGPLRVGAGTINEVGGILDFEGAQQILAVGNNGNFDNLGTMIFNPGAGNTFDLSGIDAESTGTIYAVSGTLNLPWIPNGYIFQPGLFPTSFSIPANSTFVVDPGATITIASSPTLSEIDGTVILGGAGASFPALSGLTTLNGKLSVLSGATFSDAHNLTNSGTLSVGGNVTITGNYTQAVPQFGTPIGTPTLDFQVAANPGAAAPSFTVTGSTSLSGNLTADYVNGNALTGGAYTVATFASPSNGTFTSTAGTTPFFTPAVGSTQIILNGSAFSGTGGSTPLPADPTSNTTVTPPPPPPTTTNSPDLVVSGVTAPTTFAPGSSQTFTYTVTNTGNGTATGNWQDSIFLSTDGMVDASSILIGRATHNGSLAGGASYAGTLTAFTPAVAAGAYTVLVEADSRGAVTTDVRTGDVGASGTITAVIPVLTPGTTTSGTTAASQEQVYALTLTAGTDVRLGATLAAALEANIYVSFNAIPTPETYDQAATSQTQTSATFLLHAAQTGTYYVVVDGRPDVTGSEAFTLTPTLQSYGPAVVSPNVGVDLGDATLTVSGSGFTSGTTVNLVEGNTVVAATSVTFDSANTLYATFNLTNVTPGVYGVQTTQGTGGANATLAGAFTVNPVNLSGNGAASSGPGQLQFTLSAPSFIRAGTAGTVTLFYENIGGGDIAAPLFEITADNASFQLAGQIGFTENSIDIIGTNPTGPAGLLMPGASGSVQITFTQDNPGPHVVSNFEAYVLDPSATTNWDGLKSALKPATASEAGWDQTYANFESLVGTTIGSYQTALVNLANELSTEGVRSTDASFYLSQELQVAGDFGAIDSRNAFSDFGYGQTDPYDSTLTLDTTGDAAVGSGENLRYFTKNGDGTFSNVDSSDGGVLAQNSGGTYTLTETNGEKTIYNADGTLNSFYDAQGDKTVVTLTNGLVTQLTDAFGGITTINRSSSGVVSQVIDPQGRSTSFAYDSSGNLISITDSAGTTTLQYDVPSNHEVTTITNPDGTHHFFSYDSFGRVSGESLDGNADALTFTYDAEGDVTQTDALGHAITLSKGVDGSIAAVQDALGNVLQATYGVWGTPATTTDAEGVTTVNTTDSAGDVTAIISPSGATATILYDANHHPLSITDPNGNATTFTYDANGNLLTTTDAAGNVATNVFTAQELVQQSTSAAGRVIHNTYNSAGQLIGQTFSDGTSASYSYDAHGNILSATNASGTDTFTYDSADRLTKVAYSDGLSLTYTYNSNGQLIQTVDQTGFATNYAYNAQGQLDKLTDSSGNVLAAYTYDTTGRLSRTDLGNGTFTVYAYDADGRQNSVINYAADGSITSSFSYTFNGDGQITSMTALDGVTTYAYNADGELTNATLPGGRTLTWTYDAAGNRTSATDSGSSTIAYTTNNLNEYTAAGGTIYAYDLDGNLTSSTDNTGTTSYIYNVLNELISIAGPTGTTTFAYDALGNRVTETVNGVTTDLLNNPLSVNGLVGQFSTSGAPEAQFIEGLGLVGESVASGTADYYAFDGAGNVAALTGSSGAVLNAYSYLPFGQALTATGSTANPFTFDGRDGVQDVGNGNYLTQARLYSSTLGRFTQRDPSGLSGGDTNLYRYANNNPVTNDDPSGRVWAVITETGAALANAASSGETAFSVFSLGLEANVAAAGTTVAGYASNLAANTGAFFTEAGDLAYSSAGAAYASLSPGGPTLVAIRGEVTDIAYTTGRFVRSGGRILAAIPAAAAGSVTVPADVAIGAVSYLMYRSNDAGKLYANMYQEALVTRSQDDALDKNNIIQHILRTSLGRDIAQNVDLATASLDTLQFYLQLAAQAERATQTQAVTSHDPNEIIGPSGYGASAYVPAATLLPYEIDFTNDASASAPAQVVTVTQQLSTNLDWSTFQLGNISFGSTTLTVPAGSQTYTITVSISSTLSVIVAANLDATTGVVTWTFTSIDPTTGDLPADPLSGFLPPDTNSPEGEGSVSYTVQPKSDVTTGATIAAQASIVFDNNAAIATGTVTNTIDAVAPTSTVAPLAATQTRLTFPVSWSGSDDAGGSGIVDYTVFVSIDGGTFAPWIAGTTSTSGTYTGSPGHTYAFYSIATDGAGNEQLTPAAQATTAIPAIARTLTVTKGHPVKFVDAAGATITVSITGPGSGALSFLSLGNADPIGFTLTGTTGASHVTVTGGKAGQLTLADIAVTGSLNSFTAANADLLGSFAVSGTLAALTFDNTFDGPTTITIGGAAVATTFKFGTVHDLSLTTAAAIKSLSAVAWTNGASGTDAITAPSISTLTVRGAFDANVTLTAAGIDLHSAAITGALSGGNWTLTGSVATISAASIASGWTGAIGGAITSLTVRGNLEGTLRAASIGTLSVRGSSGAAITLTSAGVDLRSASITGAISGGDWTLVGSAGTLTTASIASGWTGTVAGAITSLVVRGNMDGALTALAINTTRIGGNLSGSTISLTGSSRVGKASVALNSFTVTGDVLNSSIDATGNVGTVLIGGSSNSKFLIGVPSNTTTLPVASSAFTTAASLGSFTSKGKFAFADTIVAAAAVTSAHLTTVTTNNGGVPFGIATETIGLFTLTQPKTKTFTYTKKQPVSALASLPGDLKVEVL